MEADLWNFSGLKFALESVQIAAVLTDRVSQVD